MNVIPADTGNPDKNKRKPIGLQLCGNTWVQWKEKPISKELHEEWKKQGLLQKGLAIICGKAFHLPYEIYLNGIDSDNVIATKLFWTDNLEQKTIIEQHKNTPSKCHIYYYSEKRSMKPRKSSESNIKGMGFDPDSIPIVEVQSDGALMFVSSSSHRDGSNYEIVGTSNILNVPVEQLEKMINDICQKYGLFYLQSTVIPASEKIKNLEYKVQNTNRQGDLLSIAKEYAMRNRGYVDESDVVNYTLSLNQKLGEPYPENIAVQKGESAWKYFLDDKPNSESEIKIELKTQWGIIKNKNSTKQERDSAKSQINRLQKKIDSEITSWDIQTEHKVTKDKNVIDKTAALIKEKYTFVTIRKTNEILMYGGIIYNGESAENIIKEESEIIIEKCTTHERNEVVNKIKAQTGTEIDFDTDPNTLTLLNGILNLEKLELKEHSSDNLSRVLLPVKYLKPEHEIHDDTVFEDIEKNIRDTLFCKFLKRSFTVEGKFRQDDFETVLEEMASFFVKCQIDEKAFMHLGGGENGKSGFTEYVESLLGRDNVERIQIQNLATDKFMAANLEGKMANIFADLESDELKHTGKIKNIISGEGIEVQHKYRPAFKLYPFCKMMFSCNRFPKVYDQSQGFFRRWIIIKWERNFENDPERDEHLKDKLKRNQDEKNRIFSCLIHLSRKLFQDGKFKHSKDWKTNQKDWNANADPLDDFVTNHIVECDRNRGVRETYQFYKKKTLCKGERPLTIAQFGKAFKEYFDQWVEKYDNGKTERIWLNIDFKEHTQALMVNYDDS